tara:strand:- start:870 stop:1265 length:396 start_codon:yes stop_codon:yes gene_type:complete
MVKGMKKVGSRAEVMHGTAEKTSYGKSGLRKKDLKYNKQGRIVSKKMSARAKKEKRLVKAGYKTKKGVFGSFKEGKRLSKRRSRRRRSKKQRGGVTNSPTVGTIAVMPTTTAPPSAVENTIVKAEGSASLT